jgi:hypothetical protein
VVLRVRTHISTYQISLIAFYHLSYTYGTLYIYVCFIVQVESDSNYDTLCKKLEDKSRELRYSACYSIPSGLIYKQKSTKKIILKYKQKLPSSILFNASFQKYPFFEKQLTINLLTGIRKGNLLET